MSKPRALLFLALNLMVFGGCSTLKQNDPNEKIHAFIKEFKNNLAASDEVIKAQFKIAQGSNVTEDGMMRTIRVMQNRDQAEDSVLTTINFDSPTITNEQNQVRVDFTALFASTDSNYALQKESGFTLWLSPYEGRFVVTNIEAQSFYSMYYNSVYEFKNFKHRERDLASRKIFFDQARTLQQKYDSVIWYTEYHDSIYYYVVNGGWNNYFMNQQGSKPATAKMGLVSESGRVIVPPAYDLVGTISFEIDGVIEVRKDNRVGHFNLHGEEIIPAAYDWIIPYEGKGVYALVKQDTVYGWIDEKYTHHAGFPSAEAQKYIYDFGYLGKNIVVSKETMATSEIIHADHMGEGLVIPPAHYVQAKVLDEIITGIYIGENALGWGGTESIETQGSVLEKISEKFSALMVMLNDNYLEGREGFYERTNVTFVNDKHQPLGTFTVASGTITFHKIDSSLMELRIARASDDGYGEMDDDWDAPYFQYFSLDHATITKLESNRYYGFTKFVKIDSSYLEGTFYEWEEGANQPKESTFALNNILVSMRNEILAEYGYNFSDPEMKDDFINRDWYKPRYSRYEEFYDSMTETDRYNLEFLEKIIGSLEKRKVA